MTLFACRTAPAASGRFHRAGALGPRPGTASAGCAVRPAFGPHLADRARVGGNGRRAGRQARADPGGLVLQKLEERLGQRAHGLAHRLDQRQIEDQLRFDDDVDREQVAIDVGRHHDAGEDADPVAVCDEIKRAEHRIDLEHLAHPHAVGSKIGVEGSAPGVGRAGQEQIERTNVLEPHRRHMRAARGASGHQHFGRRMERPRVQARGALKRGNDGEGVFPGPHALRQERAEALGDSDLRVWVLLDERRERRAKHRTRHRRHQPDHDLAAQARSEPLHFVPRGFVHAQDLDAIPVVEIAGRGRMDRAGVAGEERGAETGLELMDVLRNARLGGVLAVRRGGERALLVGRDEQTDLPKTFAHCFNDASNLGACLQCDARFFALKRESYHPKSMANVPPACLIRPTWGA